MGISADLSHGRCTIQTQWYKRVLEILSGPGDFLLKAADGEGEHNHRGDLFAFLMKL